MVRIEYRYRYRNVVVTGKYQGTQAEVDAHVVEIYLRPGIDEVVITTIPLMDRDNK
jgi:hypothetical protein